MSSPPLDGAAVTTVAVVEDDQATRSRFEKVIQASPSLRLACAVSSVKEILAWLDDHLVDILLVDLGLPDGSGIDVIRRCRLQQPSCDVMVISMFGDESNMLGAFSAGAKGYLLKDGTEEDLAQHIMNLRNGGSPMSPIIARQLLSRLGVVSPETLAPDQPPSVRQSLLSPKECQVLDLVARGYNYSEVASGLEIAVSTVQTHIKNMYIKLNVHSKTEAVFEARQLGFLK